jgi:Rrf2 family cysteine metabolism transcriptional repressor
VRLTSRERCALRLMVELTRASEGTTPVSLAEIANRTGNTRKYYGQLMIALKSAGLVIGHTGRNGGYTLTRAPESISVGHVIQAVAGPIELARCIDQPEECIRSDLCECRCVWVLLRDRLRQVLDEFSLADLVAPGALQRIQLLSAEAEELSGGEL